MSSHLLRPLGSRHRLTWPAFPPQQSIIPHTPHMHTAPRTSELSFGEVNLTVLGAEIRSFAGLSLNPGFGFKLCLRGFAYQTLSHQSLPVCLFGTVCLPGPRKMNINFLDCVSNRKRNGSVSRLEPSAPHAPSLLHASLSQLILQRSSGHQVGKVSGWFLGGNTFYPDSSPSLCTQFKVEATKPKESLLFWLVQAF